MLFEIEFVPGCEGASRAGAGEDDTRALLLFQSDIGVTVAFALGLVFAWIVKDFPITRSLSGLVRRQV